MYLAPACCGWLVIGSLIFEWPRISAAGGMAIVVAHPVSGMDQAGGQAFCTQGGGGGAVSCSLCLLDTVTGCTEPLRQWIFRDWVDAGNGGGSSFVHADESAFLFAPQCK